MIPLVMGLSACQLTQLPLPQSSPKAPEPTEFLAAQQYSDCDFFPDVPDQQVGCIEAHEGTLAVVHPQKTVDIPLAKAPVVVAEPAEPAHEPDLWRYAEAQFSFDVPQNRRVKNQQKWYREHPEYMQRVNKRAAPFLHLIVAEIEKQNMPMELVLLPIVESAFDPFAYSHGRAAGMWQFIPATGKRFGMKQTWWYDGRRDVLASTRGALAYMRYLNKMFDGDWLHALAAYNSGEGRVKKAIKNNKRRGKPTDFWNLDLPAETRGYVPKLLALVDLMQRQEALGFQWPKMDNRPVIDIVDVGSQIDLALAADMAELTVEELHALNPGFNRWATDPNGPHHLLLPSDKTAIFKEALGDTSDRQRLNWVRHKVKNGDSLLKLAKRYHTSVDVIQKVNDINGNIIRAGDHLLVPVALKSLDYYSLSQEQRLASTQSQKRGSYKLTHKVKPGDTFWDISRAFNVKVRSLAKWNGMAPTDPLKPGQELVVWVNKVSKAQKDSAVVRTLTYTVRKGDSLARIANRFNVKVADITRWNQLSKQKYLQPGQKLKIFVDVTRT